MNIKLIVIMLVMLLFINGVHGHGGGNVIYVHIGDYEFFPQQISVNVGTEVVFENTGSNFHWPASNDHPTHTLYPESGIKKCDTEGKNSIFDACRGIHPSESYKFKFNEEGIYGVHDHLHPGLVMEIEVVDVDSILENEQNLFIRFFLFIKGLFIKDSITFDIPTEEFGNLRYFDQIKVINKLSGQNPDEAWSYLIKALLVDRPYTQNRHEFAHIVGNSFYHRYGVEGITHCSLDFASGCFHGVFERIILDTGKDMRKIEKSCLSINSGNVKKMINDCFHASGHGILTSEALILENALNVCDEFSIQEYRNQCYNGVFMEYAFNTIHYNITSEPVEELVTWCVGIEEKYHPYCASYIARINFNYGIFDYKSAANECYNFSEDFIQQACFQYLGVSIGVRSKGEDSFILQSCGKIDGDDEKSICIIRASGTVILHQYSGWEKTSFELCETLEEDSKSRCHADIEFFIGRIE